MKVYVDGKFYSKDRAKISVFDHGLLYGDGVFEGIRIYNGRIFRLDEHIDRLYESASTISLNIGISRAKLVQATIKTAKVNNIKTGYIRLVITRGIGTLGLNPYLCRKPQIIIIVDKINLYEPQLYDKGLRIITSATRRNHNEAISPRVKSLNYLNNILAKIEAINAGCIEALMLNHEGYIAEATGDNVFIVKNKILYTPGKQMGILEGITRNEVIRLAGLKGLEVIETALTRHDLYNADECFLTGTAAEVIPVIEIDKRKIATGVVGRTTKSLMKAFRDVTQNEGTEIK